MIQRHTLLRLAIASALAGASGASLAGFIIDTETIASQTLDSGVGQVTATGKLSVGGGDPAIDVTGSSSIDNAGTIEQTGDDRAIDANTNDHTLDVTNRSGASIESADGDTFRAGKSRVSVSLVNEGSIRSINASAGGAQAIDWSSVIGAPNTLDNRSGALIEATAADAVRPGVNGELDNAGNISALPVVEGSAPNREPPWT